MTGTTVNPFGGEYTPDPLAQFLSRVVPWVAGGYVNIHAFGGAIAMPFNGGGRAYQSLDEYGQLQSFVAYINRIGAEAFFCISAQNMAGDRNKAGHLKPLRKRENARLVKALVLDLDVKPKGYPSQRAALAAVLPFLDALGLEAGFIVSTGKGLHVYIVFDVAVPVHIWQPLADRLITAAREGGLKFDVGVTRDPVRILRLPTTFNRKPEYGGQPLAVAVLGTGPDTPLAKAQAALARFAPTPGVSTPQAKAPLLDPAIFPPRPPITYGPDFARVSADREKNRIVTSIDLLRTACPVVADSEARGGDGDREPLWFELAKLCHYIDNGRDYFHDLSSDDPRYDEQATDRKYDMAQPQGWPACATIAAASDEAAAICTKCAFYGQGQSPINYATRGLSGTTGAALPMQSTAPAPVAPYINGASAFVTAPMSNGILLPPAYKQTPDGLIVTVAGEKPIFDVPILNMELRYTVGSDDSFGSHVMFEIPLGTADNRTSKFDVPLAALSSQAAAKSAMFTKGLTFRDYNLMNTGVLDWVSQIRINRQAHAQPRFGWVRDAGSIVGFTFGGQTFTPSGVHTAASLRTEDDMTPVGTLTAWKTAANFFVGKGCIEMEILMASAFAAPLVAFTTVDGLVLFARSTQSGMGKTAALETAATVWYSRRAVIGSATENAATEKIAAMNNLPVIFDELVPSSQSARRFGELVLNVSMGREKSRLNRSSQPMKTRSSQTMMVAAANHSLTQIASSNDTNAQAARVLEIEMSNAIQRLNLQPGQVAAVKRALETNYGVAGLVYAEFLGRNHQVISKLVTDAADDFQKAVGTNEGERFWLAGAAVLFVGALLSKKLGLVDFDVASIRKFLIDQLIRQRANVVDMAVNADDPLIQLARVSQFLNTRVNNWIVTDEVPKKGFNGTTKLLVRNFDNVKQSREFVARLGTTDKQLWVSETKLRSWCSEEDYSFQQMKSVLVKHGFCTRTKNPKSLGVGASMPGATPGREHLLEFDLSIPGNEIFLPQQLDDGV